MKNHVTFLADGFNLSEPRSNFINDGNFGEDLSVWLIQALSRFKDLEVGESPLQEDWGWLVFIRVGEYAGSIGIGAYQAGTDDGDQEGWLCFWTAPKPRKSLLPFRQRRHEGYNHGIDGCSRTVLSRLHEVLTGSSRISHIRWHTETHFMAGNEAAWTSTPLAPA